MEELSFNSFTKKIFIKASMEKLYWCWATAEGICSWFLREAKYKTEEGNIRTGNDFISTGDAYTWKWHNWDGEENGEVLAANGQDLVEFSFAASKVKVTLLEEGEKVLVSLEQYDIPTDDKSKLEIHHGCSNGWTFWLANLKAYLEHGIVLNETEMDLRSIPLSAYEFVNM